MGIKSEKVIGNKDDNVQYPALMEGSYGLVVLFSEHGRGVVVHGNKYYSVGQGGDFWGMNNFTLYHGDIILSNLPNE